MLKQATLEDLDICLDIVTKAQQYLFNHHVDQWQNNYPNKDSLKDDINKKQLYVYLENNQILGLCALIYGNEPTYLFIDGQWLNSEPYVTIHRFACDVIKKNKQTANNFINEIIKSVDCKNIRVDTHKDNLPMNTLLTNNSFIYCGIITLNDGSKRKAYQLIK